MPGGDDETRQESLLHNALRHLRPPGGYTAAGWCSADRILPGEIGDVRSAHRVRLLVALELAARRGRGEEPLESGAPSSQGSPTTPRSIRGGVLPTSVRGGEHADLRVPGRIERDGADCPRPRPATRVLARPEPASFRRRATGRRRQYLPYFLTAPDVWPVERGARL